MYIYANLCAYVCVCVFVFVFMDFRQFLTQYAAVLNWNTTTTLLEGYGRLEELEVFAGAKGHQEALLEYLMRNPDGARR